MGVSQALTLLLSVCVVMAEYEYSAQLCGKEEKYSSPDGAFIYGSNAWNPTPSGFQCLFIDDAIPALDATWRWDDGSNVHSFPHVRFRSPKLPARMSTITALRARVNWTMSIGTTTSTSSSSIDDSSKDLKTQPDKEKDNTRKGGEDKDREWFPPRTFDTAQTNSIALENAGVVANVAWDFFADADKQRTYNPVDADTEIMVWLGRVGNAVPLRGTEPLTTMEVSGVDFDLYHRKNFRGHNVFTWLPANTSTSITAFDADLAPLLEYVRASGLIAPDAWLGLVEFGSETWFAPVNVTFTAVGYAVELERDDDDDNDKDGDDESSAVKASEGTVCAVVIGAAVVFAFMMSEGWGFSSDEEEEENENEHPRLRDWLVW